MIKRPRIYSDFNGPFQPTHMLLSYLGSLRDLNEQKVVLKEGLEVTVYSDSDAEEDFEMDGIVHFGTLSELYGLNTQIPEWYVLTNEKTGRYVKIERQSGDMPYTVPCFQCGINIYEHMKSSQGKSYFMDGVCPKCGLDVEHARRR